MTRKLTNQTPEQKTDQQADHKQGNQDKKLAIAQILNDGTCHRAGSS